MNNIQNLYEQINKKTQATKAVADDLKESFYTVRGWLMSGIIAKKKRHHEPRIIALLQNTLAKQIHDGSTALKESEKALKELENDA